MQMFPASPGHSCGHVEPHFAVTDHFSTDEAARGSLGDFLPRTEPKSTQQKSPRSRQKVSAAQSVAWKSRSGLLLTSEPWRGSSLSHSCLLCAALLLLPPPLSSPSPLPPPHPCGSSGGNFQSKRGSAGWRTSDPGGKPDCCCAEIRCADTDGAERGCAHNSSAAPDAQTEAQRSPLPPGGAGALEPGEEAETRLSVRLSAGQTSLWEVSKGFCLK